MAAGTATGTWPIEYPTTAQLSSDMTNPQHPPSLEDPSLDELGGRISKARHQAGLEKTAAELEALEKGAGADLGAAWRISIEIVVALVVCTAIGWALDYWFGTKPWLMLLFLFLGGAAGIINAVRTAMRMDARAMEALEAQKLTGSQTKSQTGPPSGSLAGKTSTVEKDKGERRER